MALLSMIQFKNLLFKDSWNSFPYSLAWRPICHTGITGKNEECSQEKCDALDVKVQYESIRFLYNAIQDQVKQHTYHIENPGKLNNFSKGEGCH